MNWRKFDLVEYRRGRYRLERQTWNFWDWAMALIVVSVLCRFWWVFLGLFAALFAGFILVVLLGVAMSFASRGHR
jgi:hypothetical protein